MLTIGKKVLIVKEVPVCTEIMCIILYLQLYSYPFFIFLDWETSLTGSFTVVYSIVEEANSTVLVQRHIVPLIAANCIGVGRAFIGMDCPT